MYNNYFFLIGIVNNITKDAIYIQCNNELLEIQCQDIDISSIKIDQNIALKGHIKVDGLYADRLLVGGIKDDQ